MARMSTSMIGRIAWLALVAGELGCGHASTIGDTGDKIRADKIPADKSRPEHGDSKGRQARAETSPRSPGSVADGDDSASKSEARPFAPPLASSPAGLLKPHAVKDIQEKLSSRGHLPADQRSGVLDEPTRRALRAFQRANDLPATGLPDDVTIRKLDLSSDRIFRSANPAEPR